jgi:hypothetical protein
MKSEFRLVLLILWVLGLVVSGILIAVHASMVDIGFLDDAPTLEEALNSHARIMLALGVTFGAFIAWLVVGALTGGESERTAPTPAAPGA